MTQDYSLFFIRHGKLLLPYKDHSEIPIEVLADLATLRLNPPIAKEFTKEQILQLAENIPLQDVRKIYASPSKRCQDTADLIGKYIVENHGRRVEIVTSSELREVYFELTKIYPLRGKRDFSIDSINDAVLQAMVNSNENCESIHSAYKRIDDFFSSVIPKESSLFVTHDFLMRVIEIYIKHGRTPRHIITYNELKNTQRNTYLHGFATNLAFDNFLALQKLPAKTDD